jgi:hypothetical protein
MVAGDAMIIDARRLVVGQGTDDRFLFAVFYVL